MLDSLFRPKTVAVIGASSKPLSIGNRVIRNLIDFGFKGAVYPINPKSGEICGLKAYPSILDVPEKNGIDVVHMAIPARLTPGAFEECAKMGVRNVIINSGGFSEVGPEGAAIQEAFLEIARKHNIRVMGPNCQGIINSDPEVRAYCDFTFTMPEPGFISIVALSGGVAEVIHQEFAQMGVGTRIYASNGNACDITIPEIIEYLGQDEGTRVIVTYVEGLRDPERFLAVVKGVAAKKPILAMKAGRSQEGAKAAASHTGGLAKEDLATDLIFRKAGVLTFMDEGELIQAAVTFASQPIAKGNRVGLITNTGGPAVIATDVLAAAGLKIPPLSPKTTEALKTKLYPEASVHNPVDVLATGTAVHYRACLDAMMEDDNFDSIYINFVTPFFVDNESIAREIVTVNEQRKKPMVCNLMTDPKQWGKVVRILRAGGVPCFNLPGVAARSLSALVRLNDIRNREIGTVPVWGDVDKAGARALLEGAKAAGRSNLSAAEVYRILGAYQIPVADWRIATDAETAAKAAAQIGYPVVVKADADAIVHKSDMGGVAVNLTDEATLRAAVAKMQSAFGGSKDLKFLVQKFQPGGLEVIMGAKAEPNLGHLIMFGLGGIYVEIMKDVVFELTPVTDAEARNMVSSIKGAALLEGVRGQAGVDRRALMELIGRLSQLVQDLPEIREMDLNPVMAFADRVCAVDARMAI